MKLTITQLPFGLFVFLFWPNGPYLVRLTFYIQILSAGEISLAFGVLDCE